MLTSSSFAIATLALALLPSGEEETVRVLRDPWGVPHILSTTDYGAGYGYGWALGEDRLTEALSSLWTVQGRRTEIEGPQAQPIDRTFRLLQLVEHVQARFDEYPPVVREVSTGFAAGFNAYMAAHPERVPDWAEPVHPTWPLALGRMIDYWGPLKLGNRQVRKLAPRIAVPSTSTGMDHYKVYGSNAWALAASRTEAGHAMVACDPHMPWKHEFLMHEVHMRGKSFEVLGAAFVGVPLPVFGRSRHTAWTWSMNSPDHTDVYRLKLVEGDPTRYHFGQETLAFETKEVSYAMPDGESVKETLRWSVHGPVTHVNEEQGYAVAYWFSGYGLPDYPVQYSEIINAGSLADLNRTMSRMQLTSFNLVAADSTGAIEYVWVGRVPRRPESLNAEEPLDGTDPDLLWDEFVPFDELPSVRNPEVGFVQNCNNRPENTTGSDADPEAGSSPPGVVAGSRADTTRAWYLRQRLQEKEKLSREDAIAVLTDGTMIPHAPLSRQLRAAWAAHGEDYEAREQISDDVERILEWDGSPELTSGTPTLFEIWLYILNDSRINLDVSFLERDPDGLSRKDAFAMFDAMKGARARLKELVPFLPQVPWGMVHVLRKAGRVFNVETGMYPAISLMNANIDLAKASLKNLSCRVGSAYVALHELSDPPLSWSVTPMGQTDREDLPYVHACTELFARREVKPVPFTDEQLAEVDTTETLLRFERADSR